MPQPRVRRRALARARRRRAADTVGFPAVLKPADSGGQRGVFRIEIARRPRRATCTPRSPSRDAGGDPRGFVDGIEMNGIVVARGGERSSLTLSDRLRPPGIGFGVGWIHVYPATIYGDQLGAVASGSPRRPSRRSGSATGSRSRS